jgi:alpha-tubulin suppressor-like RCC1 family protein
MAPFVQSPVEVAGVTEVVELATADSHACALKSDGTVYCWGSGASGKLGDGTTSGPGPVRVRGIDNAVDVAAGLLHSCAVLEGGKVRCWGGDSDAQLWHVPEGIDSSTPVSGPGLDNAIEVSAGQGARHSCAVLEDGTLRCWGRNSDGQVGNGETDFEVSTPTRVSGLENVTDVAGGAAHTCALLRDGTVRCWGNNEDGQLGDGSTEQSSEPVRVHGVEAAVGIDAAYNGSCAWTASGRVQCWGFHNYGVEGSSTTPVEVEY